MAKPKREEEWPQWDQQDPKSDPEEFEEGWECPEPERTPDELWCG